MSNGSPIPGLVTGVTPSDGHYIASERERERERRLFPFHLYFIGKCSGNLAVSKQKLLTVAVSGVVSPTGHGQNYSKECEI